MPDESTMSETTQAAEFREPDPNEFRRLGAEQLATLHVQALGLHNQADIYQYTKLQAERNIRLLKPTVCGDSCQASFDLIEMPLEKAHRQYTAISYCWGKAKPDRYLELNNGTVLIPITKTIQNLLEHITNDIDGAHIWIDAICINQQDTDEKSSQVAMMGELYSSAESVRIWLGLADEYTEKLLWECLSRVFRLSTRPSILQDLSALDLTLKPLLAAEWFERIWIVQEVCLSKAAILHFGNIVVILYFIKELIALRRSQPLSAATVDLRSINCVASFYEFRLAITETSGGFHYPLEVIYTVLSEQKATDPRDKIYALLAISEPKSYGWLRPDYGATTRDVYINTMSNMLCSPDSLFTTLALAGLAMMTPQSTKLGLPTWVPDFAHISIVASTVWAAKRKFQAVYFVKGELSTPILEAKYLAFNEDIYTATQPANELSAIHLLHVVGSISDTIIGCVSWPQDERPSTQEGTELDADEDLLFIISETMKKSEELRPYPTGESPLDVSWRTLIANLDEGNLADASLREGFQQFVDILKLKFQLQTEEKLGNKIGLFPWDFHDWDSQNPMGGTEKGPGFRFSQSIIRAGEEFLGGCSGQRKDTWG